MLLKRETALLSCQTNKTVCFLPGLIIQEGTPFKKLEVLTPREGPHVL